jgi:rubrerythrin
MQDNNENKYVAKLINDSFVTKEQDEKFRKTLMPNTTYITINCDGWYPECGNCGYWFIRSEIDCEVCPQCGMKVNWEDRR